MSARFIYITISQASVLLPIAAGCMFYKKLNKAFKLLFYFFILSAVFEIQTNISVSIYHNNMPGLHLFTFIEMLAFSAVYYLHFSERALLQKLILANSFIFTAVAIFGAITNGIWSPNTISRTYSSLSLSCYTLIFFYDLFIKNIQFYCWQYPMFWVSIGALIYFALNLFYFMLINYLTKNAAFTGQVSLFTHAAINIIANCLFAQAFRCYKTFTTK